MITLPARVLTAILAHSEADYPHEACGLLVGRDDPDGGGLLAHAGAGAGGTPLGEGGGAPLLERADEDHLLEKRGRTGDGWARRHRSPLVRRGAPLVAGRSRRPLGT